MYIPHFSQIYKAMRPLLQTLGDYRNLTLNRTKHFSYLTRLFPGMFNFQFCNQLMQHITKMLENSIAANKGHNFLALARSRDTVQIITTIMGIFHQIRDATDTFIEPLCRLILQTEKSLMIELSSPFRDPMVKFMLRYPVHTLDLFLSDKNIHDQQWNRFMIYLLKHKDGLTFRKTMQANSSRLIQLILFNPMDQQVSLVSPEDRYKAQHQAVLIIHTLIEYDDQYLSTQADIVNALRSVWSTDLYKVCDKAAELSVT